MVSLKTEVHNCKSAGKPRFVDRDKNVAANILLIGMSAKRLQALRRNMYFQCLLFSKTPGEAGPKSLLGEESVPWMCIIIVTAKNS